MSAVTLLPAGRDTRTFSGKETNVTASAVVRFLKHSRPVRTDMRALDESPLLPPLFLTDMADTYSERLRFTSGSQSTSRT